MIHAHDVLRNRLLAKVVETKILPDLEQLRKENWSTEFETLMRNRLIMGRYRYGPLNKNNAYKFVDEAIARLKIYQETGNDEMLVDAANYCLLEFLIGAHPKKHFQALDDSRHCEKDK